jgi:hypothetical protein
MNLFEDDMLRYFSSDTDIEETPAPAPKKKEETEYKPLPALNLDLVTVMQVQLFDNTKSPKKGRSPYAIKLECYYESVGINVHCPDWYRIVQMVETKSVRRWVNKKVGEGFLTAQTHALYLYGIALVEEADQDNGVEWTRIGHICDPNRGKHYYPGQFVIATLRYNGKFDVTIFQGFKEDGYTPKAWSCDKFIPGASTHRGFIDQYGHFKRQLEEQKKLAALQGGR